MEENKEEEGGKRWRGWRRIWMVEGDVDGGQESGVNEEVATVGG